jgi:hypothetical protein
MSQVASYEIAREPDLSLSVRGSTHGWNLLHSRDNAAGITSSAAGLLLTPQQVQAIPPLAASKGTVSGFTSLFDPLSDGLLAVYTAQNFAGMNKLATDFLLKNPISPLHSLNAVEQKIRRFFLYKGKNSTAAERLALINGLTEDQRIAWRRAAPARIDREKAQALATAVAGIKPPKGVDLLGGLRADLAFAVLDACFTAMTKRATPRDLANGYVTHVLDLKPFLPVYAFDLEICKTRGDGDGSPRGLLARRLDRLTAFDTAVRKMGGTDTPGRTDNDDETDDCTCDCSTETCVPIDPCCAEVRWYVTELLTLKDRTWRYKPSDIAYIENVAPYETRIRTHGFTRTVAETSEDEVTSSREEQRDHQVTDRFSLQTELTKNQKASLDVDATLRYGTEKGPYSFTLNTHGTLSKESAYREAREQVRDQVEKATLKMQVQTRSLRTRSVTTQQTESNKHKFKNTTAIAAVAKYFWVTQEKRGQLFSNGPRLHVDLLIPSPAMLFRKLEALKRAKGEPQGPGEPPLKPTLTPKEINRGNYAALAAQYGLTEFDEPPPERPPHPPITVGFSAKSDPVSVDIPAGYRGTSMSIAGVTWTNPNYNGNSFIAFQFGGGLVQSGKGNVPTISTDTISATGSGMATISKHQVTNGNSTMSVSVHLTADPVDIGPWQLAFFQLILAQYAKAVEKYEAKLADYQAALKAYNAEQDENIKGRHPFACEEIMRTELKRSAIFMMCGEFSWPDVMNADSELCHLPWPNRRKADKATNEWYFFDRAFDWNLASFTFYDYFRNPLCEWVDTFEPDEPNFLFKAFLRAGYCRVMVPVGPGMEEDVQDYLQSGGLWGSTGTWPHDPSDPRWVSVIDEIKHARGCYQQDREGHVEAYADAVTGQFDSRIKVFTDRYWDIGASTIDQDEINLEIDRQIFIDGAEYRIISLIPDPLSAPYSAMIPNQMSWIIGLDRPIDFAPWVDPDATTPLLKPYNWAVGAKYVGAPFHFDLPTDLIWIGDQDNPCLPHYPVDCGQHGPGGGNAEGE